MTETNRQESLAPSQELISEREVLEGLTADSIVDLIITKGEKVSEIERSMNLASEVLEGVYGLTVEQVLDERQNGNKQT